MRNPERLFQALGDETRLKILALIHRHGELCVCDIMNVLEITQSKASRHLRYLANAGLLNDRRETVWAYYRIAVDLAPAERYVLDAVPGLLGPEVQGDLDSAFAVWMNRKCCNGSLDKVSVQSAAVEGQS